MCQCALHCPPAPGNGCQDSQAAARQYNVVSRELAAQSGASISIRGFDAAADSIV
jgi:hypothetical protein